MNSNDIRQLQPHQLWENFYSLTQIPRPSGKKEAIGQFLENFGKSLGLETLRDEIGNVLIRKPATSGMEKRKPVILQAHMDMVPQKNSNVSHNFDTDPIQAVVDGDWVRAQETTLEPTTVIGLAAALTVLQSDNIAHPALKCWLQWTKKPAVMGLLL
jgi:dipeptidase D